MELTNNELLRYNRQIIMEEVGFAGQKKLKQAKVLVIGAGGLGCPALQYLAAAGVGTLGVLDFDTVSESNLQRQILYTSDDVGRPKVEAAIERLKGINPYVAYIPFNTRITKENIQEIFSDFDIIVDGSDNFPTRYLVNDACVIFSKTLVFGAIHKFYGQASVLNYRGGPTYRCLFPEQPAAGQIPNCSTIGVMGVIPGIIGNIQASEALKIILGKGDVLSGRLLQIDTLSFTFDIIHFDRTEQADITSLGTYEDPCEHRGTDVHTMYPEELLALMENEEEYILYDIREKHLFNGYRIGGEWIHEETLLFKPQIIPRNSIVVIACERGIKSLGVTEYLQKEKKIQNIYNLEGGVQAWIEKGYPLIKST